MDSAVQKTVQSADVDAAAVLSQWDSLVEVKPVSIRSESGRTHAVLPSPELPVDAQTAPGDLGPAIAPDGLSKIGSNAETVAPSWKHVSNGSKAVTGVAQPVSTKHVIDIPPDDTHCPLGWACPYLVSDLGGHKPLIQITQSLQAGEFHVVAKESADPLPTPDEVEQIWQLLLSELSDKFPSDLPSDALCQRIHEALSGCPLEWTCEGSHEVGLLRFRIRKRYYSIDGNGLIENLARDVGKFWKDHRRREMQRDLELHLQTGKRLVRRIEDSFRELHDNWKAIREFSK